MDELNIGTVIALYQKSGGKNGKHGAISEAKNISAVSRLGLQVYEQIHGPQFKIYPTTFHTKAFALIPSYTFLTLTSAAPREGIGGTAIAVLKDDFALFQKLVKDKDKLCEAMKEFRKRNKGDDGADL